MAEPIPRASDVADALQLVADLMELSGGNPFKARAYERGAHAVRHLGDQFETRLKDNTLGDVENIGKSMVAAIGELALTGKLKLLEELQQKVPPGVVELASVSGVGPKKAQQLAKELGIQSVGELEYAATENRILHLKGFGPKTQSRILESIRARKRPDGVCRLDTADELVAPLLGALASIPGVGAVCQTGALRRRTELIHQVDLLCTVTDAATVMDHVLTGSGLDHPRADGSHCIRFDVLPGLPGLLHLVHPQDQAAAQLFLTGPENHVAALRLADGALTSEGARRGSVRVPFASEEAVYAACGLPWIPPELRDAADTLDLARAGTLPRLIEPGDLQGALHNHTTLSDGRDTARAMQQAATRMGLRYLGISDHSQSAFYARGLSSDALVAQRQELQAACADGGASLWHGVESDILQDGRLDYPPQVLAQLDFVVASIHGRFQNNPEQMTQRLVAALNNPFTDVLGHPTGRLLLSREPYAFDLAAVLEAARQNGTALELNAQPQRLDLCEAHLRACKRAGVKVCINADAHSTEELSALHYGVSQARRAGLTASDVVNTLDADALREWLRARREDAHRRLAGR